MCLAIPAQIESRQGDKATVALAGSKTSVNLALVPEAVEGDWVLIHAGYAISVLDPDDAKATYEIIAEMEAAEEAERSENN